MDQQQKAQNFRDMHIKGDPVILYNIWDAGSAQAVISAGAKAVATGSHGVANAYGYEDGEQIPRELAIENAERVIAASDDLPVTMDVETGYGSGPSDVQQTVKLVVEAGIVGINIEDQLFGSPELRPMGEQTERIQAARQAADGLFINARSDLFKNADPSAHNKSLLEEALERAQAYADAGADGFFLPGIKDLELIRQLCSQCLLPVNIIKIPGTPSAKELAEAGVARISYGPVPYLEMIEWLKTKAITALNKED